MNAARHSSPPPILSLALLAGVFVMEGFDINAMALAVPRLGGDLGFAPAAFGWVFTALLVGIGIGGALLAPLGDRFGRRALIVTGCAVVAVATMGTSTATSITQFLLWRLLTGISLGAVLPNCTALSSELAPPRLRATVMAVVSAGIPLGLAAAGIAAPAIVAAAGWHGLFIVPGLFAALLALAHRLVLAGGLPAGAGDKPEAGTKLPQMALFTAPWAFPFAVFAVLLALNALNLYLLNSWLPTVLPGAGLSLDDAARVAGIVQLAGLAIGLLASLLMDRWRPGATLLLMFAAITACFTTIALTAPDATRWVLLLSVAVGGASAGGMVLPSLCAYLFPARMLSSAVGMGVLVARLGAFAGPPLGGAMLAAKVAPQTFLGVAAIPALVCTLLCLAIPAALAVKNRVEAPEPDQA
ncbi:MAG: 4-hydroxybenzoate transporter PcaK [Pseudomonadota bacterium]|jgi:AAHS family 4-hydroxybenzoate transporter-like MFS transporter